MTLNDILLLVTWLVGIGGAIVAVARVRTRVRAQAELVRDQAQLALDQASFVGAKAVIELLNTQIAALQASQAALENQLKAMRAREGKLFKRISVLENTLIRHGITVPLDETIE